MKKMKIKLEFCLQRSVYIIALLLHGVACLKMEGVIVPAYVLQGDQVELRCIFNLGRDKLYSVSWYKDHEEFYRYVPKDNPRQHTYRLEGAKVDQQRSDEKIVILRGTRPAASGLYKCEVSAEAPSFTSVSGEGKMDILSLPTEGPQISGNEFPRDYRDGDILMLNCSSGPSHPPAIIRWLINDRQVPSWFDIPGEAGKGVTSGLHLRLTRQHFPQGFMAVRCISTVGAPPLGETREALLLVPGSSSLAVPAWHLYLCSSVLYMFVMFYMF